MSSLGGLGSWSLLFPKPAVAVISARYLPRSRPAPFTFARKPSPTAKTTRTPHRKDVRLSQSFHAAEGSVGAQGTDADVKAFFDSLKVEQSRRSCHSDRHRAARIHPQSFDRNSARDCRPHPKLRTKQPQPAITTVVEVRLKSVLMSRKRKCCNNSRRHRILYL